MSCGKIFNVNIRSYIFPSLLFILWWTVTQWWKTVLWKPGLNRDGGKFGNPLDSSLVAWICNDSNCHGNWGDCWRWNLWLLGRERRIRAVESVCLSVRATGVDTQWTWRSTSLEWSKPENLSLLFLFHCVFAHTGCYIPVHNSCKLRIAQLVEDSVLFFFIYFFIYYFYKMMVDIT